MVAWDALLSDPTVGMLVADENGQAVFCNDQAAAFYRGAGAKGSDCLGLGWARDLPKDAVDQRVKILADVKSSGQPAAIRTIFNGVQTLVIVHPIPSRAGEAARFLMILRPISGPGFAAAVQGKIPVVLTKSVDLGPLSVLSPRELEVLALVGQNLSSREIASVLHRSEKTVENHRYSISKKLSGASTAKLAALARRAGLTLEDASRGRFPPRASNKTS